MKASKPIFMNVRILLLSFFLFVSASGSAQDWAPFRIERRMLYGMIGSIPSFGSNPLPGKRLTPLYIDTLSGEPGLGYIFGNQDSREVNDQGYWIGQPIFGRRFYINVPGHFKIEIDDLNEVVFLPKVAVGSVMAHYYQNGEEALKGIVNTKSSESVLTVPDSLATIKWVPNPGFENHPLAFDENSFQVSKSFGLVSFRNFGRIRGEPYTPFSWFANTDPTYDFHTETIKLIGVPDLFLGSHELNVQDYPLPKVGDELQFLEEYHDNYLTGFVWPCTLVQRHEYWLTHEICTAIEEQGPETIKSTWKWKKARSISPITGSIAATDSGQSIRVTSLSDAIFDDISKLTGFYGEPFGFDRFYVGQYEADNGIRVKVSKKTWAIDMLSYPLAIQPNSSAPSGPNSYINPNGFTGPCSTNTSYQIRLNTPIYIKVGSLTMGTPILITANAPMSEEKPVYFTPNPVVDELRVSDPDRVRKLQIFSILGRKVGEYSVNMDGKIAVENLPPGLYQIKWLGATGESGLKTILKE